jgi:hypothetical protein
MRASCHGGGQRAGAHRGRTTSPSSEQKVWISRQRERERESEKEGSFLDQIIYDEMIHIFQNK